jgi:hypothetical protein
MKLALHLPINSVSFGQVSTLFLRTLYERELAGNKELDICLFPIGPVDLSSQSIKDNFPQWIQGKIAKAFESHSKDTPIFKLWHLNNSLESFSRNQTLFTFYELDNPTKVEINTAKNSRILLSSQYAIEVFKVFGIDATYVPLAFDSFNFKPLNKKYHEDGRIVFNLCGKFERRKHHAKIIQTWIKKYGGNHKYFLQCATYNPFMNEQQNNDLIRQVVGDKPFNVNFYPMMQENHVFNDFLNSANIIIGMSGGEGWGLPEFHSIAMGKHAILLNAHAYKSWAKPDMATFVNPSGKITSVDNMFFRQGDMYNQGNIFDWNQDDFLAACETAIAKFQANPINEAGKELATQYTRDRFTDTVVKLALS